MNEFTTMYQCLGAGLALVTSSFLYSFGGRYGTSKLWRRLGSALILGTTVNILYVLRDGWTPWFIVILPLLFGAFSLGYGADELFPKIVRRSIYALANIFSGVVICILIGSKSWFVLIPHAGVGLWSVYLGVKNPIDSPAEEFFVGMLLGLGLLMYPFV